MADFIQFANNETLIMTDPVFSKEAVEKHVEKKPSYKKGKIQHLRLEMWRIQMFVFTVMKRTNWKAVAVLWKGPCRKGSSFWKSKNSAMDT